MKRKRGRPQSKSFECAACGDAATNVRTKLCRRCGNREYKKRRKEEAKKMNATVNNQTNNLYFHSVNQGLPHFYESFTQQPTNQHNTHEGYPFSNWHYLSDKSQIPQIYPPVDNQVSYFQYQRKPYCDMSQVSIPNLLYTPAQPTSAQSNLPNTYLYPPSNQQIIE
eukprot:TRINITY_DN1749_c0_g1_i1.p1 TRINITY_DN1749_c0_g1~~TRINITY_DN1749_c0_g1_i1.p1  ORF type:complete len:166 (-),score=18.50 TRINITY_DN1749_c0_g1_i1:377-874(-)